MCDISIRNKFHSTDQFVTLRAEYIFVEASAPLISKLTLEFAQKCRISIYLSLKNTVFHHIPGVISTLIMYVI